jgi:phosphatidylglycerophosphate synthase
LINVIKGGVNWVLGILALIALIILLYGWFLMVTSAGNEEQYKKWRTILQHAAIGLMLIGVAWFIISIVFWLVNQTAEWAPAADTQN